MNFLIHHLNTDMNSMKSILNVLELVKKKKVFLDFSTNIMSRVYYRELT